ncbi:precorrin-3B synthase [Jatrophihabitans sp.]|uniref:precorrin-3B synthase n=1 Tax=Jatrophihabitans sp. TaxID=1932789 RepID=UPI002F101768
MSPLPTAHRAGPQDSCPGAIRLHQAADGGLARVRVPGGVLTAAQWRALVAAAHELGNGQLELTSRGNLQLRGLRDGDEVPLAALLQDAGLLPSPAHERVRNLLASPLTGRDGAGLADVRPLITEFDRALCDRPALAELSGRFLFALDDGRADVLAGEPDIAVTATSPDSMQLLLAGRPVGAPVPSTAVVDLMLAAAGAFLAERQAQGGNAWRLAELADGPARVAARLGLPEPLGRAAPSTGRGPGGADPATVAGPDPATVAGLHGRAPGPGLVRQRDGGNALVIGIPLGSLSAEQAGALLAGQPILTQLILTPWRSIVLPDLTAGDLTELLAGCARLGMITDGSDPLHGVTACTGRPGCASALADVRADAVKVHRAGVDARPATEGPRPATEGPRPATEGFRQTTDPRPVTDHPSTPGHPSTTDLQPATDPRPVTGVHWSGCGRRCGRPAGTVIDVIATGSGYQVHQGNRSVEISGARAELSAALGTRTDSLLGTGSVLAGTR